MKKEHLPEAVYLPPNLVINSFEVQKIELQQFNLIQIFNYTRQFTQKSFCVWLNKINDSNIWFMPQFYGNRIILHELAKVPIYKHTRCSANILKDIIRISDSSTKENISISNHKCLCTNFKMDSLSKTKCTPIGVVNCKSNLEIILSTLGLYDLYKEELTFCSKISLISFDIGISLL